MNSSGKFKISVIVTVFNEISTIESLIQSLKNQSLVPDEIIIVDGGSTELGKISRSKLASRHF